MCLIFLEYPVYRKLTLKHTFHLYHTENFRSYLIDNIAEALQSQLFMEIIFLSS